MCLGANCKSENETNATVIKQVDELRRRRYKLYVQENKILSPMNMQETW